LSITKFPRARFRRLVFQAARFLSCRVGKGQNHPQRKRLEAQYVVKAKTERSKKFRPIPTVRVPAEEAWSNQKRTLGTQLRELDYDGGPDLRE
jgi:hypothetical protein